MNLKAFVIQTLRRASYRWQPRNQCLKNSRVAPATYQCNHCKKLFGPREVQVDHILPVVSLDGFKDWDSYLERMFPPLEGFQTLCKPCHEVKTKTENEERKALRKAKKDAMKEDKPKKPRKVKKNESGAN